MVNRMGGVVSGSDMQSKRITKNSLVLFCRILVITVVNLYAVKLVLRGLGNIDYGVFNAVVGVVMTCSCVFPVLAVSVQRFFSYSMGVGDEGRLREIFSASINIIVVSLIIITVLFETVGLYVVGEKLQIPACRLQQAVFIFHCAMFTFAFSYLQIPFTAAVFSHEDMNIYAYISCVDCGLKLLVAFLIGKMPIDGLVFYGAGLSASTLVTLLCYVVVGRRRYEECHYTKVADRHIYRELLSFSGWTMYGAFAGIGMMQGSVVLLNLYFGPLANAAFGVANNIYNAFTSLTNSVVLSFRPRMIQQYAARQYASLMSLFMVNNKFILYLLSCAAIPVVLEMRVIMHLWIGDAVSEEMIVFSRLFIVYTVLLAMHNPITTIMQATGRIKYYHLIVESITVMSLPLTWALFSIGLPSYMVFVSMISLCILAHLVRVACLHHYFSAFSVQQYLLNMVLPGVVVVMVSAFVALGIRQLMEPGLVRMCVLMVLSPLCTIVVVSFLGITTEERKIVKETVIKFVKH